jgi:solute carrier family 25 (mitochondrial folate transporter), member 32
MLDIFQDSHFISGIGGGVITSLILHPVDVIKVRFQVQDGRFMKAKYIGIADAVSSILSTEGMGGFYRGLIPSCWGSGLSWGLYFYFYEKCKTRLLGSNVNTFSSSSVSSSGASSSGALKREQPKLTLGQHMYAAWEGGTITVLFTNPIWLIKTRMQLETRKIESISSSSSTRPYRGMFDAFRLILREEGLFGLYKGIVPALFLTTHGMIQFGVYEEAKMWSKESNIQNIAGVPVLVIAGLISKAAATLTTYPYQVIKSRLQQRYVSGETPYKGFLDCSKQIFVFEGVKGFYKGFAANLIRVAPQSTLTLLSYETIMSLLSSSQSLH